MKNHILWQDHRVPIIYSHRKTMSLHVKSGQIELRAPVNLPINEAEAFLEQRTHWLNKTLQQQQRKLAEMVDYSERNTIPFMGLQIKVHRSQGTKNQWALVETGLNCTVQDLTDRENLIALANDFYKHQAKFWLTKKTEKVATDLNLKQKLRSVVFRRTKTKWGHCTHDGRIQFNWQIMMAPEKIIDYLVCHEVCHLKHLNHSPAFWALVETVNPNFKANRQWLKDNGHKLVMK